MTSYKPLKSEDTPFLSNKILACPRRGNRVSFQLVDESGDGKIFAGLSFKVVDQESQIYSGILDAEGRGKVDNCFKGPIILSLPAAYIGTDSAYRWLMTRPHYPLPITELQVRAEQTRFINPNAQRTAHNPAVNAGDNFIQVEVRDLVEHGAHLPPRVPAPFAPNRGIPIALAASQHSPDELPLFGVGLLPNRRMLGLLTLLTLGGCASKDFTLETDLPANFAATAEARYEPAEGPECALFRATKGPTVYPQESPDIIPEPRRASFRIPLGKRVGGCPLTLDGVGIKLMGQWRPYHPNFTGSSYVYASLGLLEQLPANYPGIPSDGVRVLNGQCRWLFRTSGAKRQLIKILDCRAVDEHGQWLKHMPGGAVQREQVVGKTVRLVIEMSSNDEPYYSRSWLKTSKGWKPCQETKETIRCQSSPTFTDYTGVDGRTCTVYPNCTE